LEQTIRYLIVHGIKSLSVNFIEPEGRATANDDLLLSPTEERKALEEIRKLESNYRNSISIDFPNLSYKKDTISFSNQPNIFCAAGTKRIAISTDGEVYPCVYAFDIPFLKVGDLKKESLQEIWEKHEAWNFMRGGIKLSQIEGCANCKLNSACSMRNCRIKSYTVKNGIYAKPHNCLIDKIN
ncbi:MAG: radical SAM protein, partial [Lactobacillus iners]|nr:radical SAM protein [Lactobacillus iners]